MTAAEKAPVAWPDNLPPMPAVDFSQFGPIETVDLSRYQLLTGAFLGRNWVQIPHVTHHDEAEIDALDEHRRQLGNDLGIKLTPLPFLIKALVNALKAFPKFNASLSPDGKRLVLKQYFHVGVAVDTDNGLLVPVIQHCDRKSIAEIASELAEKSARARSKGLPITEMSGGCMTISSLGSIGGTAFTPIINAPEVAILGVTRVTERLAMVEGKVVVKHLLPLSLSYDHRVINGADAARFCRFVAEQLADPTLLV
ncbi:pyruvate dehydrogenase E2 component (dihydrolipoamide acetyltransferase) [Pseudomonas linyingensis]|uniref:Dihydrolipoyllysine-residue acetyltransferase component of pyruvate dehydrogenase complex n=1 Tax=Pseudomonas linyingensis TaxID=915471 RepID=A0A1H7BGY9_9PSED|nr:2-oxo acid dehydrogenase subunit E2 [Pseudomonas linyingensis]SEJ76889.1 pyruvate dehydrogenase E2 component (dihydrolipoamide acetyltransferase) [Pseudomonas linyingensis]